MPKYKLTEDQLLKAINQEVLEMKTKYMQEENCNCYLCAPNKEMAFSDEMTFEVPPMAKVSYKGSNISEMYESSLVSYNELIAPLKKAPKKKGILKKGNFNPNGDDNIFEQFSKKDLVGTIRALLEEQGRATVQVENAGESFLTQDLVVTQNGKRKMLSFRSLVDKEEE